MIPRGRRAERRRVSPSGAKDPAAAHGTADGFFVRWPGANAAR